MESNCPFCNSGEEGAAAPVVRKKGGFVRRVWRGVQWLFPGALLVLTPKCPMCVVAFVALTTGVGISVGLARWIQILLPVLAVTSLAWLVVRHWKGRGGSRV